MKKNLIKTAMALVLAVTLTAPVTAAEPEEARYITFEGVISEVYADESTVSILVAADDGEEVIYNIYNDTVLMNMSAKDFITPDVLSQGMRVAVSYGTGTPAAMSAPPRINPEVVVVIDGIAPGSVKTDYFNEDGLSSDGQLKIILSDKTQVTDVRGAALTVEDTREKALVVFYDVTTRSIPPQTAPLKVIVLDERPKEAPATEPAPQPETAPLPSLTEAVAAALEDEHVMEMDGILFVGLRAVAEALGYSVEWDEATKTATLQDGEASFTVMPGSTHFGIGSVLGAFEREPFITNDRMFVEAGFIEALAR